MPLIFFLRLKSVFFKKVKVAIISPYAYETPIKHPDSFSSITHFPTDPFTMLVSKTPSIEICLQHQIWRPPGREALKL